MPPIDCSNAPITPPASGARVVPSYAHTLWEAALGIGVPPFALAAALGRDGIHDQDLPVSAYMALLDLGRQYGGAEFGWRLGQQVKLSTYGVNGILLLACPTLGEALQQVLRFESLVHDLGRSSFKPQGEDVVYTWRNDCASHPDAATLTESVFSGIQTCGQWLVEKPLTDFEMAFTHHTDEGTAQFVAQSSGARLRWGAAQNQVVFPAALLAWPIPQANTALLPLLQRHAMDLLQARHPRDIGVAAQVRQSISGRLGRGTVKLADVAADLNLSTRTLQRRLTEAGVAYQMLLDTTRHELARHYLSSTAMPTAEIAYLLGFQDTPAFHHAFKSWEGRGPGQYRASVAMG
jgi:AraC-like DNA-binding protein